MRFIEAKNLNNEWSNLNLKNLLSNINVFTVNRKGPQPQPQQQQQQQQCIHSSSSRQQQQQRRRQCMECSTTAVFAVKVLLLRRSSGR